MNAPTDVECNDQAVAFDILQVQVKALDQLLHNMADIDDPRPGTVIAGRIEADHLGEPFKLDALLIMQVLDPAAAAVSVDGLYILDDGGDVAIVRLQGESPDLWIVDRLSRKGGSRRCALARRRWHPRAALTVE
jgi:hypothetical protein